MLPTQRGIGGVTNPEKERITDMATLFNQDAELSQFVPSLLSGDARKQAAKKGKSKIKQNKGRIAKKREKNPTATEAASLPRSSEPGKYESW